MPHPCPHCNRVTWLDHLCHDCRDAALALVVVYNPLAMIGTDSRKRHESDNPDKPTACHIMRIGDGRVGRPKSDGSKDEPGKPPIVTDGPREQVQDGDDSGSADRRQSV